MMKWLSCRNSGQAEQSATVARILRSKPLAIVMGDGLEPPPRVAQALEAGPTALIRSDLSANELANYIQYYISRSLAERLTLHGVFLEVFTIGVLITGDAGSGKSELALELLNRGHRLIADDAPEFTLISPEIIDGTCPEVLQDCLEVRGLGVLNVRHMFGDAAVKLNKFLRLIIHLEIPDAVSRSQHGPPARYHQQPGGIGPGYPKDHAAGHGGAKPFDHCRSSRSRLHAQNERLRCRLGIPRTPFANYPATKPQPGKLTAMPQKLILVTGLSGGGKSTALRALEDLGYYCADNLPAALLPEFAQQIKSNPTRYSMTALGVDARSPAKDLEGIAAWLKDLSSNSLDSQLLFLTADSRAIIKRFSETRRRHPLTRDKDSLPQAIAKEVELLSNLKERADWVIDTSDTNIHQLAATGLELRRL